MSRSEATETSQPSASKRKNSSATLTCVQTLIPPRIVTTRSISKADALLSSYVSEQNTGSSYSDSPVWDCAFSHDGTILATCHGRPDPCIRLWKQQRNVGNGGDGRKQPGWTLVATLRDVDGSTASTSASRTIRSVSFAPTPNNVRKILAAASFDGSVSIWEDFSSESNGKNEYHRESSMEGEDEYKNVNDPSSNYQNTVCGWECTAQLEGHDNEVKDVTWNATGTLLASCGRDKSVWIWECSLPGTIGGDGNGSTGFSGGEGDFDCIAVLQAHGGDVKKVAFAPSHGQFGDGDEILLSASYDDTIKIWAEDGGEWYCALTLSNVHTSTIWDIALSPGGVRMVSGSADESLAIWRCYTASEKEEFEDSDEAMSGMHSDGFWKCVGKLASAHSGPIYSVDCAPSRAGHGRIVSGGSDDCINIYREVGGTPEAPLFTLDTYAIKAHDGDVNCVKWHPVDGRMIASAGDDGLVKVWKYTM